MKAYEIPLINREIGKLLIYSLLYKDDATDACDMQ